MDSDRDSNFLERAGTSARRARWRLNRVSRKRFECERGQDAVFVPMEVWKFRKPVPEVIIEANGPRLAELPAGSPLVYESRGKLQTQLLCGADDNPRAA